MKILKPGKVEQRKFTCPKCGCEFLASMAEIDTDIDLYVCPQEGCHYYAMGWDDGEPYEEPTRPTQSDLERLAELLQFCGGPAGDSGAGGRSEVDTVKQNICWDCQKATGGCSWSEINPDTGRVRFQPPDGAIAVPVQLDAQDAVMTHHITWCPEFVRDEPRKTDNLELRPGTFLN